VELVDTHCHLHLLDQPAADAVAAARAEGVGRLVDVGVDLPSSRQAAANAARLAGVWAAAGVHPNAAASLDAAALGELRGLLTAPRVVAVGETGLDYYREGAPRPVPRAAFASHLRLGRELARAVVVHCRDAWDDLFAILAAEGPPERVVLHCFTGDERRAARALELGCHLSFSGTVTFANAPDQRAACRLVPLDRMVLETDSPFLSPHPYRGRPNRPGRVAVTAAAVAAVHGLDVAAVAAATSATAERVFRLGA
jgi:TatD DNase family protein